MATIYAGSNPPAGGGIYAADPTQAFSGQTPALAGGATAAASASAAIAMAQQLAGAAIAAAAAAAQATLRQALTGAATGAAGASAGLSVSGGNAKLVTPVLRNSTFAAIAQQTGVRWWAVSATGTPAIVASHASNGAIAVDHTLTVQDAALQVGTDYVLSAETADGYRICWRLTAQAS